MNPATPPNDVLVEIRRSVRSIAIRDSSLYCDLAARYRAYVLDVPADAFPTFLESLYFERIPCACLDVEGQVLRWRHPV